MKFLFSLVFFSFLLFSCTGPGRSAASANPSKTVKKQAETMAKLLLKRNYKKYTKYVHPKLVEIMGGENKFVEWLEKSLKDLELSGGRIESVMIGNPSEIISHSGELQCTVPQVLIMKVPGGTLVSKSALIAISENKGQNWYFLDTSDKNLEQLRNMFPNLSPDLKVIDYGEPSYFKDASD